MAGSRIITVDPSGAVARIVRAATELMDRSDIIHIHVPGGNDALQELGSGGCELLITTIALSDHVRGFELALRVKQMSPETQVIILADIDDPEELDDETLANSPFVYMHRPVDPAQFVRVLLAGMNGHDLRRALESPALSSTNGHSEASHIPDIDPDAALGLIDSLMTDVGAQAVILANRAGEVLLERGVSGLNRDEVSTALKPVVTTTIDMRNLVGGNTSTVQFYDGADYDVYVLSVGLHHFLCLIFDGQTGARQFGVVNRFGRQTAEDLIALLGASAFILEHPAAEATLPPEAPSAHADILDDEDLPLEPVIKRERPAPVVEPEALKLEPIADDEFDASLFDDLAGALEESDDLFDPDKLSKLAGGAPPRHGAVSYEEAKRLGIVEE